MRQKYKEAYGAYRAYVREFERIEDVGIIMLMDEFGAEAIHMVMRSFRMSFEVDRYSVPSHWRYDDIPF